MNALTWSMTPSVSVVTVTRTLVPASLIVLRSRVRPLITLSR